MSQRAYDASSTEGRLAGWQATHAGVNALLGGELPILRARARDLFRQNPIAYRIAEVLTSNLVGTGIRPSSRIESVEVRRDVMDWWDDWITDAGTSGIEGFYQLLTTAVRAMIEGGESFVVLRPQPLSRAGGIPLKIQILESEFLPVGLHHIAENGNQIRDGIEYDTDNNRRVAYHFYASHPGEYDLLARNAGQLVRVPAQFVGHLYRINRPGQSRGEPWLTQAMLSLRDVVAYNSAELVRKGIVANYVGFITKPPLEIGNAMSGDADTTQPLVSVEVKPGTFPVLFPGEQVTMTPASASDTGGGFSAWLKAEMRIIAASTGMTYEQLSGDMEGVTFSSARVALLESRRLYQQIQHNTIIPQFCQPVWNAFIDAAIRMGIVQISGYRREQRRNYSSRWTPQGWQHIDPNKEVVANAKEIEIGTTSRDMVILSHGGDPEEVDRSILDSKTRAESMGLDFSTKPMQVPNAK